jgi:hypothetical protein
MATALVTTWETQSSRSGPREWGAWACLACGEAPKRPTRLDRARADLARHIDLSHPGVEFIIETEPRALIDGSTP